jgi:uncharacterized protein YcbK (DUF882 family)
MMDRRLLLAIIAGSVAWPGISRAMPVPSAPARLNLVNAHTGETFSGTYRDADGPIPTVMDELSIFLRDFHADARIAVDVGVLDFLAAVMQAAGQASATILSAYRTPETNAMLARTNFGVAENSQHMYGRALDVHFGAGLEAAMRAARAMKAGGVGWYPHSGFMHIDSGPVRNWDLDDSGLGALIAGGRSFRFDMKGNLIVSAKSGHRGGRIATVRERHARLRQLAHAEYWHRLHN